MEDHLTGQERRVLTALCNLLNAKTFVAVQQAHLARRIGMHKAGVFCAIEKLIARGILERGQRFGHSASFRLNEKNMSHDFLPTHEGDRRRS